MTDYEPLYCDRQLPEDRVDSLAFPFSGDIFRPRGFLEKTVVKGEVLDLGCGRGGVGAFLRKINPKITLTGVDVITEYQGENCWDLYSERRKGDASHEVGELRKEGRQFDLVIACGLPPKATERLIGKISEVKSIIRKSGVVLFVFDIPISTESMAKAKSEDFELHNGTYPTDPYILFWQNNDEEQIEA